MKIFSQTLIPLDMAGVLSLLQESEWGLERMMNQTTLGAKIPIVAKFYKKCAKINKGQVHLILDLEQPYFIGACTSWKSET